MSEIEKIMEEQVEENPHPAGNGELKTRLVEFETLPEGRSSVRNFLKACTVTPGPTMLGRRRRQQEWQKSG